MPAPMRLSVALSLVVACLTTTASAEILDPNLSTYRPVNELSGEISLMGSTTMTNMAAAWTDSFNRFYPDVKAKLEIRGSRGAVPAVITGEADFGLLSRKVHESEITAFKEKFGYEPEVVTVCLEHMAIYVHPDNPVRSLTLKQLQSVLAGKAKTWGDVGLEGAIASQPIRVHGRKADTGSRVFLEQALRLGSTHKPTIEHSKNSEMIAAVAADPLGLGYAGLIFQSQAVKDVPLAFNEKSSPVKVDSLAAAEGQYPLMRPLQLVVNRKPGEKLSPVAAEFAKYVLSRSGQEDVLRAGFQPIREQAAVIASDKLETGFAR